MNLLRVGQPSIGLNYLMIVMNGFTMGVMLRQNHPAPITQNTLRQATIKELNGPLGVV